jgi:hypothetical protein
MLQRPEESALEFLARILRAIEAKPVVLAAVEANSQGALELRAARTIVARGKRELSPMATMGDPVLVELVHEYFTALARHPDALLTLGDVENSIRAHLAKINRPIEPRDLRAPEPTL